MKKILLFSSLLFSAIAAVVFMFKKEEEELDWQECGRVILPKNDVDKE